MRAFLPSIILIVAAGLRPGDRSGAGVGPGTERGRTDNGERSGAQGHPRNTRTPRWAAPALRLCAHRPLAPAVPSRFLPVTASSPALGAGLSLPEAPGHRQKPPCPGAAPSRPPLNLCFPKIPSHVVFPLFQAGLDIPSSGSAPLGFASPLDPSPPVAFLQVDPNPGWDPSLLPPIPVQGGFPAWIWAFPALGVEWWSYSPS